MANAPGSLTVNIGVIKKEIISDIAKILKISKSDVIRFMLVKNLDYLEKNMHLYEVQELKLIDFMKNMEGGSYEKV